MATTDYLAFIWSDGIPVPEALDVMRRELPPWIEDADRRGLRLLGRELELPDSAVTVRLRGGETLVTDGPFPESKEFIAGFDLLRCADLDEAAALAASSPIARFHPIEVVALRQPVTRDERVSAFGRDEDDAGTPYLLGVWSEAGELDAADPADVRAWRDHLPDGGVHILGGALVGSDARVTVREADGHPQRTPGSHAAGAGLLVGAEVIRAAGREAALSAAVAHPLASTHAIDVRPFHVG